MPNLVTLPGCGCRINFTPSEHAAFITNLNQPNYFQHPSGFKIAHFLRTAINTHSLVIISNLNSLSPSAHVNLTSIFGEPGAHPQRGKPPALPCLTGTRCLVEVATNDPASPYLSTQIKADHWHSDVTFSTQPPSYTSLLAKQIPGEGRGDTMWASTSAAFAELSPALQRTVSTLFAVHRDRSGLGQEVTHPVVVEIEQQQKGMKEKPLHVRRRALFVNQQFTSHFAGWTIEESAPLLNYLYQKVLAPEHVYRHRWSVGDFVVWDNRQTLHYGIFDSQKMHRTMHRTTAGYNCPIPSSPLSAL